MVFVGIVTDSKSENNIEKLLSTSSFFNENNVIFIKEKNINNIKNVHFDTVIVNKEFSKMEELNKVLASAKNISINADISLSKEELNITNSNLITYGFNSKSSITISSVTDDDVLVCIQRNIYSNYGEIEVQEIKLENNINYSIYDLIIVLVLFFMYIPDHSTININSKK
ncbi:MAG: hypothetical protein IKD77_00725 [Bacilli bacterium]|nr:hypothetical protein [Bacilli bacterium]